MTAAQNFFMISGMIFWYLTGVVVISFIAYLLVRPIPEPKAVDLTGKSLDFSTYDKNGRKQKRRELHESMKKGKGA